MSTATEILARRAQALPVIERIRAEFTSFLNRQTRRSFRVSTAAARAYHGRRARRQAFYQRQRKARVFTRLLQRMPNDLAEIQRAQLDMLTMGVGVLEVTPAGARRVAPTTMFFDEP